MLVILTVREKLRKKRLKDTVPQCHVVLEYGVPVRTENNVQPLRHL